MTDTHPAGLQAPAEPATQFGGVLAMTSWSYRSSGRRPCVRSGPDEGAAG